MNKVSKVAAMGGAVIMSLALAGCQNMTAPAAPQKAPEVVLQESMNKLASVTSYNYNVKLMGALNSPVDETGKPSKPEKVNFNMNFTGGIDLKDPKDPRLNLNAKGDMMADADGGSGEAAFRMNKTAMFATLMSLDGKGTVQIPEEMKLQVMGKWWTMPVPPTALEELSKSIPQGADANLTPEQKKMKDLVEKTKFFKDVKYVGDEKVGSENSAHYTAILDEDAFTGFVQQAGEMQSQKMTDQDKADLKDAMAYIDFSGDMFIGKDSGVLTKMKGTLTFKAGGKKPSPTGSVSVEAMVSDLNKPVTVEVPKDAQEIPAGALPM